MIGGQVFYFQHVIIESEAACKLLCLGPGVHKE